MRGSCDKRGRGAKPIGKGQANARGIVLKEKKPGSFTWSGFIGFQPDSESGVLRAGQIFSCGVLFQNVL